MREFIIDNASPRNHARALRLWQDGMASFVFITYASEALAIGSIVQVDAGHGPVSKRVEVITHLEDGLIEVVVK